MAYDLHKISFDLTIKKSQPKDYNPETDNHRKLLELGMSPEYEVYEELNFKGLTLKEIFVKLVELIPSWR